jgi:hypothetical protein
MTNGAAASEGRRTKTSNGGNRGKGPCRSAHYGQVNGAREFGTRWGWTRTSTERKHNLGVTAQMLLMGLSSSSKTRNSALWPPSSWRKRNSM